MDGSGGADTGADDPGHGDTWDMRDLDDEEREDYWESRRGEDLPGAQAWEFYTDPHNLKDLGRTLVQAATPMAVNVARALFSGNLGLPSLDAEQSPAPDDIPDSGSGWSGPRMRNVAAPTPQAAEKATVATPAASDQPKRTATGTPKAGIMANVRTTPYGLLGDAPVTRKTLLGA